ncbi:MAG: hypothetical protein F6K41_34580 [Symploca sp. SIO3E6]|nr:hypothetical protein [Caldora sp. SIO3E6]
MTRGGKTSTQMHQTRRRGDAETRRIKTAAIHIATAKAIRTRGLSPLFENVLTALATAIPSLNKKQKTKNKQPLQ